MIRPGARPHPSRFVGLAALILAILVAVAARRGFSGEGDLQPLVQGLREPCAVASTSAGRFAVADAAADSVSLFDRSGNVLWTEDQILSHPLGLDADSAGVWVADTGHHRVVLLDAGDGHLLEAVDLPTETRPTDVAVAQDGALWISVSAGDRLLRVSADRVDVLEIGSSPERTFSAPRGLAPDGSGGLYVAEALGGRLHHLDARGETIAVLGELGVGEARFGKPKDVALLEDGSLAVLDTQIGTIQVLDQEGTFLRMLAAEDGPIQFDHPLGIAVDGGGFLVADAARGAVYRVEPSDADLGPGDLPHPSTLLRRERGALGNDDPSALCRQCHDGTRKANLGNWDPAAHQHTLDLVDPAPEGFATTDRGDLKCASCHDIHGDSAADEPGDVTDGHCATCHPEAEPAAGRRSHALDEPMERRWDRDPLLGRRSALPERTTCLTCHTPHGAMFEPLLVAPREGLCLACHTMGGGSAHPTTGALAESAARAATAAAGGLLDADGRTTCLSCHDVHEATGGALLRFAGGADGSCEACHERTDHGSRWHPDESCTECHSMHERAVLDSSDCGACHEEQRDAKAAGGHGSAGCLDCHPATGDDPAGDVVAPDANPASQPCLACHQPAADVMEAPRIAVYDHPSREIIPPAGAVAQIPLFSPDGTELPPGQVGEFACSSCHVTHGPEPGATTRKLRRDEWKGTCATCHGADALIRYSYFHRPGRGLE